MRINRDPDVPFDYQTAECCYRSPYPAILKDFLVGQTVAGCKISIIDRNTLPASGWLHDFEFPLRGRRIVAERVRAFTGTRIMLSRQPTINCLECRSRNIHLSPSRVFFLDGSHVLTFPSVSLLQSSIELLKPILAIWPLILRSSEVRFVGG